jgi:DNA-binding NtrC family response regulator
MHPSVTILIVEDEHIIALSLGLAVEDSGATLIGPVDSVAKALALVERGGIAAAVIDANLVDRDVTPLALCLMEQSIPFVVHTATGLPPELAEAHPDAPVILKPARADSVIARLLLELPGAPGAGPKS